MTDETTDISVMANELFIFVLLIQNKSHFWGNFDAGKRDASIITDFSVAVLYDRGIPSNEIWCLGSQCKCHDWC